MPLDDFRAGGQRRDLLLLLHLPVDIGLDVGVIDVDDDHFRRPPCRAARLDRAGGAVADLQERHEARGAAAARQLLVLPAQSREIGAGAGAVFEQARFPHPQVHDAALVDEVVGDRLDEAGVRLRVLVGRLRLDELAGLEVDVIMALARPVDAIGPVEPGVEPLRRIGRGDLARQHEAHLVVIGARVLLAVEIAGLPAPVGPGAGEPVEHLPGRDFRDIALVPREILERLLVRDRPPQERRHAVLLDLPEARRNARLAEIFLRQHVGRHLAPGGRNLDVVEREHHRAVRIADLALRRREGDRLIGRRARLRVVPLDPHRLSPSFPVTAICPRSPPRVLSNVGRRPAFLTLQRVRGQQQGRAIPRAPRRPLRPVLETVCPVRRGLGLRPIDLKTVTLAQARARLSRTTRRLRLYDESVNSL